MRKRAEEEQRESEIAEQMQREIERRSGQLAALNETGLELTAELTFPRCSIPLPARGSSHRRHILQLLYL